MNRIPVSGWSGYVGIFGGIPTGYTMYCNVRTSIPGYPTLASGNNINDDAPAINSALTGCPNGKYVYVPSGNYKLNSPLVMQGINNFDNVQHPLSIMLSGDGPSQTKFYFSGSSSAILLNAANDPSARVMNVTGGGFSGTKSLMLDSIDPYFMSNLWVVVLHANDAFVSGTNAAYMNNCRSQMVKVTGIVTGSNTIFFTPPLNEYYSGDKVGIGISAPYRCGLDSFYIENKSNNGGHNINLVYAQECWIRNVESNMASKWHIRLQYSAGCEIRECYTHDGWDGFGDTIYGYGLYQYSCSNLIENNFAERCRHAMIIEYGGQNNVFGYNYSRNSINADHGQNLSGIQGGSPGQLATDYLMGDIITHGGEPRYNLWEGNVAAIIKWDNELGTSSYNTAFRNQIFRQGLPATYVACFGTDDQSGNYYTNLIGNIYQVPFTNSGTVLRRWGSQGDTLLNDTMSSGTAFIDGEYDIQSGVYFWNSGVHALPASYYLNQLPSSYVNYPYAGWPSVGIDTKNVTGSNPVYWRINGYPFSIYAFKRLGRHLKIRGWTS